MPLSAWTDQQIFAQMNCGRVWSASTISYAFANTAAAICTNEDEGPGFAPLSAPAQARAELALALWDDLILPDLFRTGPAANFRDVAIEFGMTSSGRDYSHAYSPGNGSVWFNSTYTAGRDNLVTPPVGLHGFETYIHEIGHAFGLRHMGNYNMTHNVLPSCFQDSTVYSVMSYYGPNWQAGEGQVTWADWVAGDNVLYCPQTPMMNDIKVIQQLYGAETTTRAGDTVYGFNSTVTGAARPVYDFAANAHPVLCLYDSGGRDTLDLSGFASASVINLAPGSFSDCDNMTYNISIARSTDIENAVGGSAADTITGNALANTLNGNQGDDTLAGLDGADSLRGGAGNDMLDGGAGDDAIDGGQGTDTARFSALWSAMTVSFDPARGLAIASAADGSDTLNAVESFVDGAGVRKSFADIVPCLSVAASPGEFDEGGSGTGAMNFAVTLSTASPQDQSVSWSLVLGSGPDQASVDDFAGPLSGTVLLKAGQTSATIAIGIAGDTVTEDHESFGVVLSNASSGTPIIQPGATGTIYNDDFIVIVDIPLFYLSSGDDVWYGTDDAERLFGLKGDDILNTSGGDDRIIGGTGQDVLTGGAGRDIFRFSATALEGTVTAEGIRCDTITDFQTGADQIFLAGVDADPATGARDPFVWRGSGGFTGTPGELRFEQTGAGGDSAACTMIYGSTDADPEAEFAIRCSGLVNFTAADFAL